MPKIAHNLVRWRTVIRCPSCSHEHVVVTPDDMLPDNVTHYTFVCPEKSRRVVFSGMIAWEEIQGVPKEAIRVEILGRTISAVERHSQKTSDDAGYVDDLITALAETEENPGLKFIALKWFRDGELPQLAGEWASDPTLRQEVIAHAITDGVLATGRVENPTNPKYPTTTIRLNRDHPAVQRILKTDVRWRPFKPVKVKGVPLSRTILEERR